LVLTTDAYRRIVHIVVDNRDFDNITVLDARPTIKAKRHEVVPGKIVEEF
jgi:hypothetical protein